jgi:DNA-binding cell septation regulator SpoVG
MKWFPVEVRLGSGLDRFFKEASTNDLAFTVRKVQFVRQSQSTRGNQKMNVNVKLIQPATKPHRLADAIIELADSTGDSLVISDIRILQNRQGQLWVAMPSRSVSEGGRSFQYFPQIEANRQLARKIEDAVLAAYQEWKQSQSRSEVRNMSG